jgi:hypothetical protein
MGRPPLELDEELIRKLAEIYCTYDEIALIMGCCRDTLHRKYSDVIKKGHTIAKRSLRRAMFDKALNGKNTTMMIWLSKQYLGMTDKVETHQVEEKPTDPESPAVTPEQAKKLLNEIRAQESVQTPPLTVS